MAKRYRYAFVKRKESSKGKLSVGLSIASLVLFPAAIILSVFLPEKLQFLTGCTCLFAALLSAYGFLMGLLGFSEEDRNHRTNTVGSILNGVILVGWISLYLMGG